MAVYNDISCCEVLESQRSPTHLVLEIYRRIEVGDFRVDGFAQHLAFASVDERTHLWEASASSNRRNNQPLTQDCCRRTVRLLKSTATC